MERFLVGDVMLLGLALGFLLVQDADAELLQRLQAVSERAGDLDPFVRAEAAEEAAGLYAAHEKAVAALAQARRAPAMIVAAIGGRQDGAALLRQPDRNARRVGCDLVRPTKESLPELLGLLEVKDLGLRIAACRALGRVEDPELRKTVSSAMGHGMRRTGSLDLLFALVTAAWRGTGHPQQFFLGDGDPERAGLSIAAACNVPGLSVTEGYSPTLLRVIENEKIDRGLRSLLIRVVGRRSPWALFPVLPVRDPKLRSEIVDVLDRSVADPLVAPALYDAWRSLRPKKLGDGKNPGQPVTAWIEGWLKRLCGESVTPEAFPDWVRTQYRARVDRQADAAIERGVSALRRMSDREALWKGSPGGLVGVHAFAAYALLKCEVAPDDPLVARCLDLLLDRDPDGIYNTSLAAMALATAVEKGAPRRERLERRAQRMADILVASQLKSGGWSYVARVYPDQSVSGWGYDLSNTQFAILGLRAAANAGAKIPRTAWERSLALLERTQGADGGWSYQGTESPSYHRMTAAGASSWILCRISLDEKLSPSDAAEASRLREALRWLERSTDASQMPPQPDLYLLYSLERLCMIAGIERLGGRDWYVDGATILLRAQGGDGAWSGSYGAVPDTCLALLFLRKAFIARPDVPTETAGRRAGGDEVQAVYERRREDLFVEGVKDIRTGSDNRTSFVLIVVDSDADLRRLTELLGREIDGVPLRIEVDR